MTEMEVDAIIDLAHARDMTLKEAINSITKAYELP